jgi:hypothetical protein
MINTIYKFELGSGEQVIEMPKCGEILTVQGQQGVPHLWVIAIIDVVDFEKRHFVTIGAGGVINEGLKYIGTYQESVFVWHVFERIN